MVVIAISASASRMIRLPTISEANDTPLAFELMGPPRMVGGGKMPFGDLESDGICFPSTFVVLLKA